MDNWIKMNGEQYGSLLTGAPLVRKLFKLLLSLGLYIQQIRNDCIAKCLTKT